VASEKVREVLEAFRAHFMDAERARVPLALRQESPDVVFNSLLEEDKPHLPTGGLLSSGLDPLEVPPELPGAPQSLDQLLAMSAPEAGLSDPGLASPGLTSPQPPASGLTPDDLIADLGV